MDDFTAASYLGLRFGVPATTVARPRTFTHHQPFGGTVKPSFLQTYASPLHDLERDEWLEELEWRGRSRAKNWAGFRGRKTGRLSAGRRARFRSWPKRRWGWMGLEPSFDVGCTCPTLYWPGDPEPVTSPPEPQPNDQETERPGATLVLGDWKLWMLPADLPRLPDGARVYVVVTRDKSPKPYYVGISATTRRRWTDRLREARQAGVLPPSAHVAVWTASVAKAGGGAGTESDLRLTEHALVRLFRRSGLAPVNRTSTQPFRVRSKTRIEFNFPSALLRTLDPAKIAADGPGYHHARTTQSLQLPAGKVFEAAPAGPCPLATEGTFGTLSSRR